MSISLVCFYCVVYKNVPALRVSLGCLRWRNNILSNQNKAFWIICMRNIKDKRFYFIKNF